MEIKIFENLKKLFDSAQYHTARSLTPRSITLQGVRLGAVSHCAESDLAQYRTARSPTWRSVIQFWIFGHFHFPTRRSLILPGVGLGAVWYCAVSESEQYHNAPSHVFCEYLSENKFFSETILDCLSGTQMGLIHEKKIAKNLVTLPLCVFGKYINSLQFLFILFIFVYKYDLVFVF